MGFQTRVNAQPVPGIAGDFAGCNPRASVVAPPGGYTAAPDYPAPGVGAGVANALIVGRFAWANYATGLMANYFQPASILGFVHRESQTVITAFLDETRVAIQEGFPCTAHNQGDFWADFVATAPDAAGLTVYADPLTGAASADAAGQGLTLTLTAALANTGVLTVTATSATSLAVGQVIQNAALGYPVPTYITAQLTGSAGDTGTYQTNQTGVVVGSGTVTAYGKQETKYKLATPVGGPAAFTGELDGQNGATFTGVIASNVLTVTALTGVLHVGDLISGTGVAQIPLGPQLSGFPGSVGTYQLTHSDVGSEAMTSQAGPNGVLKVTAVASGTLAPGMYIAGTGVPSFAQIIGQLTQTNGDGPGARGTYLTNLYKLVGSESMTANQGTNGKISTWQA